MLLDQQPSIAGVEESLHIFEQRVRVIRERHFWRRKSLHPGQRLAAKNRGKVMLPGVDVKFDIRDGSGRDHGVKQTARGRTSSAGLRTVPRATSSAPTQRCHGPRFAKRWRSSRSDCAKAGSFVLPKVANSDGAAENLLQPLLQTRRVNPERPVLSALSSSSVSLPDGIRRLGVGWRQMNRDATLPPYRAPSRDQSECRPGALRPVPRRTAPKSSVTAT